MENGLRRQTGQASRRVIGLPTERGFLIGWQGSGMRRLPHYRCLGKFKYNIPPKMADTATPAKTPLNMAR